MNLNERMKRFAAEHPATPQAQRHFFGFVDWFVELPEAIGSAVILVVLFILLAVFFISAANVIAWVFS